MGRLVVIGNGPTADIFLHQVLRARQEWPMTIFGGSFLEEEPELCAQRDIEIRPGVRVVEVDRHALVVVGDDGSRTPFERLVLATGRGGLVPHGLQAHDGRILVNHNFETSDGHIYAIGECAEPREPEDRISFIWQARTLAAMLTGNVSESQPVQTASSRPRLGKILQFPSSSKTDKAEKAVTA
jgi:NAD(P)H-nitrite reductase large subunit